MKSWWAGDEMTRDWQRGMSYDDLHAKYGPHGHCECDSCEKLREVERVCELLAELTYSWETERTIKAIDLLIEASREEKEALKEVFDIEGFGGAEWHCITDDDYRELAERKLAWLREERACGERWE